MHRWTILGCIAIMLIGASAVRADDRKDIEALYAKLKQALVTNHPEATLAMETPDFKSKGADGRVMTGKQLVQEMKMEAAGAKLKKMDIHLDTLSIKGKTASASTSFTMQSEVLDPQGHMGPKGKKHVMGGSGKIHNDLVKTVQGWKFKDMEEKDMKMTMDGKPFNPMMMAGPPKAHKK